MRKKWEKEGETERSRRGSWVEGTVRGARKGEENVEGRKGVGRGN